MDAHGASGRRWTPAWVGRGSHDLGILLLERVAFTPTATPTVRGASAPSDGRSSIARTTPLIALGGPRRARPADAALRDERPLARQWAVRARSFEAFDAPRAPAGAAARRRARAGPLRVLDLGAGNGWLSHRAAVGGARGAGARRARRPRGRTRRRAAVRAAGGRIERVAASFEAHPARRREFDVVGVQRVAALRRRISPRRCARRAAWRAPAAGIVVLDSPFYRREADGEAMVRGEAPPSAARRFGERAAALHGAAVHRVPHPRAAGRRVARRSACAGAGTACAIRSGTSCAPLRRRLRGERAPVPLRPLGARRRMILFVNPRATRPKNRRFPLSVMAVGAALPAHVTWEIVDGNLPGVDPLAEIAGARRARSAAATIRCASSRSPSCPARSSSAPCRSRARSRRGIRDVPIVWGGNFASLYPAPVLERAVRRLGGARPGRGHLRRAARRARRRARSARRRRPRASASADGSHCIGAERRWDGPDELPAPPYHKIDVADYLHPTFLGRRSGVYQASIGCPYGCKFCGVISRVRPPREGCSRRRARREHLGVPRARARHGLGALLRQQLLRQRGPGARVRRAPRAARPALVVRGAGRRAVRASPTTPGACSSAPASRWCSAAPSRARTRCWRR